MKPKKIDKEGGDAQSIAFTFLSRTFTLALEAEHAYSGFAKDDFA